jgi:hypothetical protein
LTEGNERGIHGEGDLSRPSESKKAGPLGMNVENHMGLDGLRLGAHREKQKELRFREKGARPSQQASTRGSPTGVEEPL